VFAPLQKGENTSLIVERMKKLEELGFSWSVGRGSGSAKDERGICSYIVRREKTFQSSLAESADFDASMVICGSHVPQLTSNTLLLLALFPRLDYNTLAQKWQPRIEGTCICSPFHVVLPFFVSYSSTATHHLTDDRS
jgi:hypothetical protein